MRSSFSLLFCLLVSVCTMAQAPVADFTVSVSSGCAPLGVNFTDKSTGSPTAWFWDFGNNTLSQQQNPSGIGFSAGTYSVTLTVKNANGVSSVTKTNLIVANPSPTADFTADRTITCLPNSIQFTDKSVANAGSIVKWDWGFDDLSGSTAQNPSHSYANAGYYSVSLQVTSSTGCKSTAYKGRYLRMLNGVKANFEPDGPSTCAPPFDVTYKNLTSGPGTLTYAWDLGNGSTSTANSPLANYPAGGSYTVKLTAQSDYGCSDSVQKTVPINGITTAFTAPANVCLGSPAAFQITSTPTPSKVLWDFGDGTTSNQPSPSKTFNAPGTYTVKLYSSFASCSDSVVKTVVVSDKPSASFSATKNNTCKPPLAVTFTNTSPDAVSSAWTFGDGATASSHPTASHTYTSPGSNNVTLTITDSKGCKNSVTQNTFVNIFGPNVQIANLPPGVCVGESFSPSPNVGSIDGVASYAWDFGDGTPVTTASNPTHSYASPGVYAVKLSIVTNDGCAGSVTGSVRAGLHPVVDFKADKLDVCHGELVAFTNLSTPVAGSTALWDFDDKRTSNLFTPAPQLFSDSGLYSVKLKITSDGCSDSLTKVDYIHVKPPVANFGYSIPDCTVKTNVLFADSTLNADPPYGPLVYKWNFGDPASTTSTLPNPTFNYPAIATYNVKLVVSNNVCTDSIVKPVKLYNGKASFKLDKTTYCRKERVTLFSFNDLNYVKTFTWVIDGVNTVTDQLGFFTSFDTSGTHTAQLITTDINGCADTSAPQTFTVTGPVANFKTANKGGCTNSNISFTDQSTTSGTLTKWIFDFGDGTAPQTFTAGPFTHKYANAGSYDVKLTVFDNTSASCSDTFTLRGVVITNPLVNFGAEQTVYCPGTPLQFADSSSGGGLTYNWLFGDGGTANVQNPTHAYNSIGKDSSFTVKLFVTDSVGCTDSLVRNNYVNIRTPKPLFSAKDTITLCPPLETKLFFKGRDVESYTWDFGDGTPTSSPSLIDNDTTYHFYNSYGNFIAKLYAYGFGGCVDSASVNIRVTNPYSNTTVSFDPKTNCNDLTVNFNITTPFGTAHQFYFGDGAVDTSQALAFQHFYSLPNVYSPAILLYDSTGCQAYFGGFGIVDIKGGVPIFGKDKSKFCDSGTVYFTDYSQEAHDPIVKKTWDFGDGVTTVSNGDIIHTYQQPGLFLPALTVTTAAGCDKTYTDTVRVLATPTPIITSADGICNDLVLDFKGSLLVPPDTAITWKWDFGKGNTSVNQNVSVNFPDTGLQRITLEAINSLGCKGDTAKTITVFPLPSIKLTGDTTLISGAGGITVPLTYSSNASTFSWTPEDYLSCTNCGNPFANPKFTTKYNVKVTDDNGCISSRNLTLVVLCNDKNFFIPNTFSPNNDGANDRFYPRGRGLERIQALRIFNRWGEMVFEKRNFPANDAASGWDGSFKGKTAASDTYIYMIDIICENATIITYKGNITLIR